MGGALVGFGMWRGRGGGGLGLGCGVGGGGLVCRSRFLIGMGNIGRKQDLLIMLVGKIRRRLLGCLRLDY